MRKWVLAAAMVAAMPVAASAADAEAGKTVFNKCKACHQVGEGAKNAVGPNLTGVIGRKAGSEEGFNYSEAMKNSGLTWDEATFEEYITNPRAKVPGNKMVFMGLKSEDDRKNLFEYLKTFSK
ncbi:MAG: cytochrome c family protein [Hyphomicrobiaceae bacterium]|nr:cytochrome c family protein [Hyphomicrobiaceae bacterium]